LIVSRPARSGRLTVPEGAEPITLSGTQGQGILLVDGDLNVQGSSIMQGDLNTAGGGSTDWPGTPTSRSKTAADALR